MAVKAALKRLAPGLARNSVPVSSGRPDRSSPGTT